jgi:predicted DNA-binding transcriptional regulator AlpA
MGRKDNHLSHTETAEILGISRRHLWRLVNKGFIFPADTSEFRREPWYSEAEVYALLELRMRRLDMPSIAAMALRAQATSRTANDRLGQICQLLGIQDGHLGTDEESIFNLYVRVRAALREDLSTWKTGAIMEWAATINLIDEAYLELVEHYTTGDSPWEFFLQLANDVMMFRDKGTDPNLDFAFSCMDAARRNLRCVSYFYVLRRHGYRVANRTFAKNEATDAVIAQLYPRGPEDC